jgi:hypothetical protein
VPATLQQKCGHFLFNKHQKIFMDKETTEILYQVPSSMYILFWMAGMAFVVSATRWMYNASRSPTPKQPNFVTYIWKDQILNLFFVCIASICIGILNLINSEPAAPLYAEIFILGLGSITAFALTPKQKILALFQFYARTISFGILCLIGWGITIATAFALQYLLKIIVLMSQDDYFFITFMITGGLWCAPPLILYRKILHTDDLRANLNGKSFHKFLWPMLFAYLFLLIPLLAQEVANSEEWRRMTNPKPIKSVQVDMFEHTQIFPFV